MDIGKLPKKLRDAYRGSNIARRVQDFESWMERATPEAVDSGDYDHAQLVKDYYDLYSELMVWSWGESLHFDPSRRMRPWRTPKSAISG